MSRQLFQVDDQLPFSVTSTFTHVAPADYETYNYMEPEPGAVKNRRVDTATRRHVYVKSAFALNHPAAWQYHRRCMAALRPHAEVQARIAAATPTVGYVGACRLRGPLSQLSTAAGGGWGVCVWTAKTVKRPPQQPAQPPKRQLLGATDAQTAHPATFSTAPAHQILGSANAETTPARAPAAAADRTQRPDATCEGETG